MSLATIPVSMAKKLEGIQGKYLWGYSKEKRRSHLVALEEIKKPLSLSGLGL